MSVRLKAVLQTIRCTSLNFPSRLSRLLTVSANAELQDAFKVLIDNRILAAPVVDESGRVISVLSAMTLVEHFLNVFNEEYIKGMSRHKNNTFDVYSMRAAQHAIPDEKVRHLHELGGLDPMQTLPATATMYSALQEMVANKWHRVIIVDDAGAPVNMLTQFQMVEFLSKLLDLVPVASRTVGELYGSPKPVVSVPEDAVAYDAFKRMCSEKVSAVAVVDKEGKLVGNLSATDIALIGPDARDFAFLTATVGEYLQELHSKQGSSAVPERPIMFVYADDSLHTAVKMVHFYRIHRVYIVDSKQHPIGVLALHDILATIFEAEK